MGREKYLPQESVSFWASSTTRRVVTRRRRGKYEGRQVQVSTNNNNTTDVDLEEKWLGDLRVRVSTIDGEYRSTYEHIHHCVTAITLRILLFHGSLFINIK